MRAFLALRPGVHYRREAFRSGLKRAGYVVVEDVPHNLKPRPGDVLVIWNRYGWNAHLAAAFEAAKLPVLVAENGYLGNEFAGERWYAMSLSHHNGAGTWPKHGSPARWDALGVTLAPFRDRRTGEAVILPQRGIGPPGVAMPPQWLQNVRNRLTTVGIKHRVRPHPGQRDAIPLEEDLRNASVVWTWGSGAALKALVMGISVNHEMPGWIGSQDNTDAGRLAMFRRLAWAMWTLPEITKGTPFELLLNPGGK